MLRIHYRLSLILFFVARYSSLTTVRFTREQVRERAILSVTIALFLEKL